MDKKKQEFYELVREQEKQGRVVILSMFPDGHNDVSSYDLDTFISQPIEGLLYDLNRLPEVVATYIDDPKWVNDYAVYLVIKRLKEKLAEYEAVEK